MAGGGFLPVPHAPESGPALYWLSSLFMIGADDLREAFARRYVFQAAVAPVVYLALARATGRGVAVVAGLGLAVAPGLLQTLDSGYQGYLAPDVAAGVAAGLVVGLRSGARSTPVAVALVAVPIAMMCHPLAIGLLPPVLVAAAWAWREDRPGRVRLGIGLSLAAGLGIVRLVQLVISPEPLWVAATSNASGASPIRVVADALFAIPGQDGALFLLLLVAAAAFALRAGPARRLAGLFGLGLATLCLVGATIGYLQPYHLRILLPLAVTVVALGLAPVLRGRRVALAGIGVVLVGAGLLNAKAAQRGASDLDVHATFGEAIRADAGDAGRWVEFATIGDHSWGSPAALVLDGLLRGESLDRLRSPGPLYLVVTGEEGSVDPLAENPQGQEVVRRPLRRGLEAVVLRFDGPSRSALWTRSACLATRPARFRVERRAADWLAFVRPGYTDEFTSRWFDPCVRVP